MKPTSASDSQDELVNIPVPRRHYALVVETLARALATEHGREPPAPAPAASVDARRAWSDEEVVRLRESGPNKTIKALMDLTCRRPGTPVSFPEVYEHAGRTYHQARADLAGLSKLLTRRFGRENWPVRVAQRADGILTYEAEPAVAKAWTSGARA